MTRADQRPATRQARLARGACPTHGVLLTQTRGDTVGCPRKDCNYTRTIDAVPLQVAPAAPGFVFDNFDDETRRRADVREIAALVQRAGHAIARRALVAAIKATRAQPPATTTITLADWVDDRLYGAHALTNAARGRR